MYCTTAVAHLLQRGWFTCQTCVSRAECTRRRGGCTERVGPDRCRHRRRTASVRLLAGLRPYSGVRVYRVRMPTAFWTEPYSAHAVRRSRLRTHPRQHRRIHTRPLSVPSWSGRCEQVSPSCAKSFPQEMTPAHRHGRSALGRLAPRPRPASLRS
jgi:hypothetical protein